MQRWPGELRNWQEKANKPWCTCPHHCWWCHLRTCGQTCVAQTDRDESRCRGDHPHSCQLHTLPILKLGQTWMPFLQASVWYVWYIRLLFNPTIYQTYSYSVLPCLRGFLVKFCKATGKNTLKSLVGLAHRALTALHDATSSCHIGDLVSLAELVVYNRSTW